MTDTPPVPEAGEPVPPPAAPIVPPVAPPATPVAPTYGTAPAYQAPAQAPGVYPVGYSPPTNTLAIVALILGFFVPIGGIICGHIALGQIKRTGEGGRGLALAGTILGYVFTGLIVLFVIIYIVVIVAAIGVAATYGNS